MDGSRRRRGDDLDTFRGRAAARSPEPSGSTTQAAAEKRKADEEKARLKAEAEAKARADAIAAAEAKEKEAAAARAEEQRKAAAQVEGGAVTQRLRDASRVARRGRATWRFRGVAATLRSRRGYSGKVVDSKSRPRGSGPTRAVASRRPRASSPPSR